MKIPEYNRNVNAPGGANIRMSPNAPKAAFGVAVDTGVAIGKGLQNLGGVINELEVKRQEDIDRAVVTAALSDYMKRSTDLMYNAETGFLNAVGKGAEGLTQRAEESFKTMEQEVRGQLKNRNQQGFFDRAVASHRTNAGMNIMKHEVKALGEWRTEEAKNLEASTALAASRNLLDPANMATLTEVAAVNARNKYGDQGEEQNGINMRKEMSSLIILSAGYAASDGRYDDAERFLDFNKNELDPVMYENATKELKKLALPARAQEMAEKLFKENGIDDIKTAREYIRNTFQGAEENAYMSALEGYYTDKKSERAEQKERAMDSLFGLINNGTRYGEVLSQLKASRGLIGERGFAGLKDQLDKKFYVGEYANRRPVTRQELFDRVYLLSEIRAKMRTGEIANVTQLSEMYGASLSNADFQTLGFEIAKGQTGQDLRKKDPYDVYDKSNPVNVVSSLAKDNGVTADPYEEMDFWKNFRVGVESLEKTENRKATEKEIIAIGQDLVKDKVIRRDYNAVEKGLINVGVPSRLFTPDVTTTAKGYQIEAAGAIYDPDLDAYYVMEDGVPKGWIPDTKLKPQPKSKQKYPDLAAPPQTNDANDGKAKVSELLGELGDIQR